MKIDPTQLLTLIEGEVDPSGKPTAASTPPAPAAPASDAGGEQDIEDEIAAELQQAPAKGSGGGGVEGRFTALKELAKKDLPTLRHLTALKKIRDKNSKLTGKDSNLTIQAILNRLDRDDPAAAMQLGTKQWEPNELAWIEFFDEMGDKKLGEFLGINSHDEIPKGSGIDNDEGLTDDIGLGAPKMQDDDTANLDPVEGQPDPATAGNPGAEEQPPRTPSHGESASLSLEKAGAVTVVQEGRPLMTFAAGPRLFERVHAYCKRHALRCAGLDLKNKKIIA